MKKKYILLMLVLFQIILLAGGQLKKVNAEEVNMYTVTFHSDYGFLEYYTDPANNLVNYSGGTADDKDYVINVYDKIQTTQLPWGIREGYRLKGWKIEGSNNPDDTLFVDNYGYGQRILDYEVTEDVTFVAQWEKEYTLTFYSEYGYINGDVNQHEYILNNYAGSDNLSFRCPSISGCEGYVVTGWRVEGEDELFVLENTNTSEGKKNINEYIVTRDTTFIAQWEKAWNVKFYSEKGYISGDPEETEYVVQVGNNTKINNNYVLTYVLSIDPGYVFTGWKVEGDENSYVPAYYLSFIGDKNIMEYVVTEDVTFVAQWEEAYSVTFYSEKGWINGDSEKKEDKTYVKKDSVYKYKTPSVNDYNGYIFSGWKVDGDDSLYVEDGVDENYGINIKNINEYEVTKDVTFIAQWEKAYNITFYSDEGFYVGRPDEEEYSYQIICNKKIGDHYFKCGINDYAHRIAGWKIDGDDTLYVERNENLKENEKSIREYVVTGDVKFIAQWEEAYYKVTFYSEEGYLCHYEKGTDGYIGKRIYGGSFEDKYYELLLEKGNEIGSSLAAWGNRNEYKIAGWVIDDNKALKIEEVWAYIPCEDMTLVAQWEKIELTGETDINNGNEKGNSTEGKQNTGSDALKNADKGFESEEKDVSESELRNDEANNIEHKQDSNLIGDTITYKSAKYKVLADGKVEYVSSNNKKIKSVVIPDTISDGNGNKYKVTEIADNAFKNYKKLTKVTIGKNVTKIGKNAFYGCKQLSNITIKSSSLKSVGKNAIKGINKKATIKVPKKCYTKYKKLFKSKTGYKKTMKIKIIT